MDITPAAYAHWRESELGSITERLEQEAIFSQVSDLRGWNVLDAGCGDGTYAIEAARRGAIVTGLDLSWSMLIAARQREQQSLSKAGISWCRGQVEALPFQDASFDLVFAITLVSLVSSPNRVISELARVLRPGGILLLGELGGFSTWALARRIRGWLGSEPWKHAHFWTTGKLHALLRDAGLDLKSVRGAVYYPPSTTWSRLTYHWDRSLSILGEWGAAFLAVKAIKPLSAKSGLSRGTNNFKRHRLYGWIQELVSQSRPSSSTCRSALRSQ